MKVRFSTAPQRSLLCGRLDYFCFWKPTHKRSHNQLIRTRIIRLTVRTRKLTGEDQRLVSEGKDVVRSSNCQLVGRVGWGGGLVTTNFQLLLLSLNLLKSKIPITVGGGSVMTNFQKVNFKFSESSPGLKFPFPGRGGGGGRVGDKWNVWYLVLTSSVNLG